MATHSIFLPGESHRQRSLVGYIPKGCKESDTTEPWSTHKWWLELEQSRVQVAGDSAYLSLSPYSLSALPWGLSMWASFNYLASCCLDGVWGFVGEYSSKWGGGCIVFYDLASSLGIHIASLLHLLFYWLKRQKPPSSFKERKQRSHHFIGEKSK